MIMISLGIELNFNNHSAFLSFNFSNMVSHIFSFDLFLKVFN